MRNEKRIIKDVRNYLIIFDAFFSGTLLIFIVLFTEYSSMDALVRGTVVLSTIDFILLFSTALTVFAATRSVVKSIGRRSVSQGSRPSSVWRPFSFPLVCAFLLYVLGLFYGVTMWMYDILVGFAGPTSLLTSIMLSMMIIGWIRMMGIFIIAGYLQLLSWRQGGFATQYDAETIAGGIVVGFAFALIPLLPLALLEVIDNLLAFLTIVSIAFPAGIIGGESVAILSLRRSHAVHGIAWSQSGPEVSKKERRVSADEAEARDRVAAKVRPVGSCIVCRKSLYADDLVVSCPHCRGIAHKGDLLEWIHVKGTCPACGRHLDEDQVQVDGLD